MNEFWGQFPSREEWTWTVKIVYVTTQFGLGMAIVLGHLLR
jgi:hypothetical protein